jgi:hypothetical protein
MLSFYSIVISGSSGTQNTRNTRQRTDTIVPHIIAVDGSNQAISSKTTTGSPNMGNVLAAGQKYVVSVAGGGMVVRENVPRTKMSGS